MTPRAMAKRAREMVALAYMMKFRKLIGFLVSNMGIPFFLLRFKKIEVADDDDQQGPAQVFVI